MGLCGPLHLQIVNCEVACMRYLETISILSIKHERKQMPISPTSLAILEIEGRALHTPQYSPAFVEGLPKGDRSSWKLPYRATSRGLNKLNSKYKV